MAWVCPVCEEINTDNNIIICQCGYEIEEQDTIEFLEFEQAISTSRLLGIFLIYVWQLIPVVLVFLSDVLAVIFLMMGGAIAWSFLGLGLGFSLAPKIIQGTKPRNLAILINIIGFIGWIIFIFYADATM